MIDQSVLDWIKELDDRTANTLEIVQHLTEVVEKLAHPVPLLELCAKQQWASIEQARDAREAMAATICAKAEALAILQILVEEEIVPNISNSQADITRLGKAISCQATALREAIADI